VKIAIIDSGIFVKKNPDGSYAGNPCFNDAGYSAPRGFPKGDTRFTNNKVLVARAYHRPGDPPKAGEETPVQGTNEASPHGTHVAGIAACNANTRTFGDITISGIAPGAYLMNYRVFYVSQSPDVFQSPNAYVAELVQAIEDAVADGADVINGSWGSSYQNTLAAQDPMVQAVEAAVDAGVTVVLANGNSGPALGTGNSPANSPKVIAVGAVTKFQTLVFNAVDVTAPAPVPANLVNRDTGVAQFGPAQTGTLGPAPIVAAERVATNGSSLGCSIGTDSPFPAGSLTGQIVLIQRGTCEFSNKVFNAQRGGAIGALVYNSAAGGDNLQSMGPGVDAPLVTIPSLFLRRTDGLNMVAFANANPGTARAQMVERPHSSTNVGNVIAGFSSNGPTQDKTLKPDLVAPGVDVVSGGYATGAYPAPFVGFGAVGGTSMASPHVAGAAALLKHLHPGRKPADIKSALMTTANEEVFATTARTARAGVLARGAGLIDLSKAGDPGLLLEQPSLSGGEFAAGQGANLTLRARNARGGIGRWNVSVQGPTGINVSVPSSVRLLGSVTESIPVRLDAAPGTPLGDYEGKLVLTNGSTTLHVPFWLRVVPASATKTVLLVDDDGSSDDTADFADFSAAYKALFDGLGISYDYLDVWASGFPILSTLQGYQAVMIFTGNNTTFDSSGFSTVNQDVLAEYLDSGGKLWTSGQNFAETSDSNIGGVGNSPTTGRARLYHGYLGLRFEDGDAYNDAAEPRPTANGLNLMQGLTLDVSAGADGAGNQTSIEVSSPLADNDTFQDPETVVPFFRQIGGDAPAGSAISFGRSSEPSLSQPQQTFRYRSVSMGFGLEAVNSTSGSATRQQLARRALDWLLDSVNVSLPAVTRIRPARETALTATASSSLGTITQYRWNFGDGSPILTTTTGTVEHRFRNPRATVLVEVTDSLGHRAVATTLASVTGR